MPMSEEFPRFAAALFAIMNPFGNIAIFLSITADRSPAERGRIATMTTAAVLITLLVVAVLGEEILALFDISVGSFRIAGGIIILILALSMLHAQPSGVHHSAQEEDAGKAKDNPAVFPLAIPLIAGPGSMATVILYSQHAHGLLGAATIGAVIVLMCRSAAADAARRRSAVEVSRAHRPQRDDPADGHAAGGDRGRDDGRRARRSVPAAAAEAAERAGAKDRAMKITAIDTIQLAEFSNLVWVELHTDEGLVGLGETFRNPQATAAYIHETCAPYLLGKDPLQIERHAHALMHEVGSHFAGFPSRSVEVRGNSAVDCALWDLFGKAAGLPLHQLLGGLCRERIRIYNTCASAGYNREARTGANSCWRATRRRRRDAARRSGGAAPPARPSWRARCWPRASAR